MRYSNHHMCTHAKQQPSRCQQITPGGSLANSLVAYAMLNNALLRCMPLATPPSRIPATRRPPAVAFAGPLGADAMGQYFSQQMRDRSVHVLHGAALDSATGTVAVLTTPDAQRSFLSYLGSGEPLGVHAPTLSRHLPSTQLLLIEGYLWEAVDGPAAIRTAASAARASGARVALTCGDAGIVDRHAVEIVQLLRDGMVDVLFANKAEALALLRVVATADEMTTQTPADACAMALGGLASVVLVTDGANGAAVVQQSDHGDEHELHIVPPCWQKNRPADTNGAGDAFAGAFLFGWLGGIGVRRAGRLAARTAAAVITRPGASLTSQEARRVVLESFGLHTEAAEEEVAVGTSSLELGWQS